MRLKVYGDKGGLDLVCDIGSIKRVCDVPADGSGFSLDVIAFPPVGGYTGYKIVLEYLTELTLQQQTGVTENRHPGGCSSSSESDGTGSYELACGVGEKSDYADSLANVQFVCPPEGGLARIDLIGGTGAGVSAFVNPSIEGSLIFLNSETHGGKEVADSVVINCVVGGSASASAPIPLPIPTPPPRLGRPLAIM